MRIDLRLQAERLLFALHLYCVVMSNSINTAIEKDLSYSSVPLAPQVQDTYESKHLLGLGATYSVRRTRDI